MTEIWYFFFADSADFGTLNLDMALIGYMI